MTQSHRIMARVSACLTPQDTDIIDADLASGPQMSGPDRRARLALRIALLRQDRVLVAPIAPPPPPEPEPEPEPQTAPEPEIILPPAPPKRTKPPKIKMSTVGLDDAAALLGSAFDDFPDQSSGS